MNDNYNMPSDTSYTKEEWDSFATGPGAHGRCWGTKKDGKTYYIPYDKLKIGHLKNIVKWMKDRPEQYRASSIARMEQILKEKIIASTPNGRLMYEA